MKRSIQRALLIDTQPLNTAVAILEKGKLTEFFLEGNNSPSPIGSIYRGKVENILSGMETAFINIGLPKNGFLYLGENSTDKNYLPMPKGVDLSIGDYCMVQITKDCTDTKGVRLTANITLPGKYVVISPHSMGVGVSAKITDEAARMRLETIITKALPRGYGAVARTASLDAKKSAIVREINALVNLYSQIEQMYYVATGVEKLYDDGSIIYKLLRELDIDGIDKILCNCERTASSVYDRLMVISPDNADKTIFYDNKTDMLDDYGVMQQVDELLSRKVALEYGGSLVIDTTEALTVIDVNSGCFDKNNENHEINAYELNCLAAKEIARQLRLRNIGGIIVVDFLDMADENNRKSLLEYLAKLVVADRAKVRVGTMSPLGLVEITRKRTVQPIAKVLLDTCPECAGQSLTYSAVYMARKIKRDIRKLLIDNNYRNIIISLNPHLLDKIAGGGYLSYECENLWSNTTIYLLPDKSIGAEHFTIKGDNRQVLTLPSEAQLLY